MKVSELIDSLKKFNPDADITTPYSEDICLGWIYKDPETGDELTKQSTMQVFIEQTDSCPTCVHEYTNTGVRMCSFYQKPCKLVEECYQYEEFTEYE